MGKVTVKEQAGNKQKLVLRAARVREWIKWETKHRLTHDHEGEQVSIKKVPNDWLVPGFYTHHSSDQVNQWDCLKGNIKTLKPGWFRLQSNSTCVWGGVYHLADVVSPGQEQDAGVVFLPMRQDEGEQHHPQYVIEYDHTHATLPTPKYGVHGGHEKHARPTVQTMVKQLPQWRGGVGAASLLTVHTVFTTRKRRE